MKFDSTIEVSIIGAGGLGVPAAWSLVSNWPKNLFLNLNIFDPDCIEISNLNRQVLFSKNDIGKFKAEVLTQKLTSLYSKENIKITNFNENINKENITNNLSKSDFVLDATDSVKTKFLINDFCITQQKIFCYAGAVKTQGQLLFINPKVENNGCLHCLFGDFSEEEFLCQDASCQQDGILAPIVGYIGSLQANYVINFLSSPEICSKGAIFHSFELVKMHLHTSHIKPSKNCLLGCCIKKNNILDLTKYKCPETFLYTKLALEEMKMNEVLDVRFSSEKSINNVILSSCEEGHSKLEIKHDIADNLWRALIQRGN